LVKECGRHVPMRTCIACRRKRPKAEMIRLTLDAEGGRLLYGGSEGRGAYVCRDAHCWKAISEGGRLRRAFKREVKGRIPADPPWNG